LLYELDIEESVTGAEIGLLFSLEKLGISANIVTSGTPIIMNEKIKAIVLTLFIFSLYPCHEITKCP
jgi:hypothetical protein